MQDNEIFVAKLRFSLQDFFIPVPATAKLRHGWLETNRACFVCLAIVVGSLQSCLQSYSVACGKRSVRHSLFLLLLIAGDVHVTPGPPLRLRHQPSVSDCLQAVTPVGTPSDGHCSLHAVSGSIKAFLSLLIPVEYIINATRMELANNMDVYRPFTGLSSHNFVMQIDQYLNQKRWNL